MLVIHVFFALTNPAVMNLFSAFTFAGPDLIKNGLVIPPWTHEIYGSVDYTHTY
jgi:hypothetical protein